MRAPSERYDTHSYRRAIARACRMADREARQKAIEDDSKVSVEQVFVPSWRPNRLRHNRATELRPYGLDVAKTVLGHSKVETSQVYAEKDMKAAMDLVARLG